jgi:cystathionine beta-lyase/cystathionine gamma-synthase
MLSFELKGGVQTAKQFMKRTILPVIAPSLGGVETLLTLPSETSHSGMRPEDRKALGISDGLVRMSVGIEGTEDIIEDFQSALVGL